jgi:hypothetical protein
VCRGKLDLTDAQACIAQDWEACAVQYPRRWDTPLFSGRNPNRFE